MSGGRRFDRRSLLKGFGAAALTGAALPGCDEPDAPEPTPAPEDPATLEDAIDTVVVLMLENRSFDHIFGGMSIEEGRDDIDGPTAAMSNPRPGGEPVEMHPADLDCIADPPHSWSSCRAQVQGGAMDGFVQAHHDRHGEDEAHRVMGYWNRAFQPATYRLAEEYALCTRWFSSVLGPTFPNRLYAMAATSGGRTGNDRAPLMVPHLFDRLQEAGVRYGGYVGNISMSILMPGALGGGDFRGLEDFADHAQRGVLPPFTLVEPVYGVNDDHPPNHPLAAQVLIATIYRALAASPQWERSLLIVTYDEHGGFFDHVPPPLADDERAEEGFDQLGVRVPGVVIGPYVRAGAVSSVVRDHASILAFCERLWDLEPLTERDAAADDLTELLDADRIARLDPAPPIDLPAVEIVEEEVFRPECSYDLFRDGPAPISRQPELEAIYDALPEPHPLDLRADWEQRYRAFLASAEAVGAMRRRDAE